MMMIWMKPTRYTLKEHEIVLTDDIIENLDKKRIDAISTMNWIYANAGAFRDTQINF